MTTPLDENALCRSCGYCLRGLPQGRCPECGCEFDPADPRTFRRRGTTSLLRPWTWNRRVVRFHLLMLASSLPFAWLLYAIYQAPSQREQVSCIRLSPDGKLVARASEQPLAVFDVQSGRLMAKFPPANWAVFSPDSSVLVATHKDGNLAIWDLATKEQRATWKPRIKSYPAIAFSPDSRFVATSGNPEGATGTVQIWGCATGGLVGEIDAHNSTFAIAYSPDGQLIASLGTSRGTENSEVAIHNASTLEHVRSISILPELVRSHLALSADGRVIVGLSGEHVWSVKTGGKVTTDIASATFDSYQRLLDDGPHMLTISRDQPHHRVRVVDVATKTVTNEFKARLGFHWDVHFDPDVQRLTLASHNGAVRVYDLADDRFVHSISGLSVKPLAWHWYAIIALWALWCFRWTQRRPREHPDDLPSLSLKLRRSWWFCTIVLALLLLELGVWLWGSYSYPRSVSIPSLLSVLIGVQILIIVVVFVEGLSTGATLIATAYATALAVTLAVLTATEALRLV